MQPLTDAEVETLKLERDLTGETIQTQATRIFQDHGPAAAVAICKLALHATNERVKLTAAQYVVERNLGRLQDNPPAPVEDPYKELLREISVYVDSQEAIAAVEARETPVVE